MTYVPVEQRRQVIERASGFASHRFFTSSAIFGETPHIRQFIFGKNGIERRDFSTGIPNLTKITSPLLGRKKTDFLPQSIKKFARLGFQRRKSIEV